MTQTDRIFIFSIATSIDAFAVGLSIACLKVPILLSVIMIEVVALILSVVGLFAGTRLGEPFRERMEFPGGLILLGVGIRIVLTHTFQRYEYPEFDQYGSPAKA